MVVRVLEGAYVEILDCVHADHDALREIMIDLETSSAKFDEKRVFFQRLTSFVESTLKSAESIVLPWANLHHESRHFAIEAMSKQELADHLLRSIRLMANEESWEANITVYCDLLRDYMNVVERSVLPDLFEKLNADEKIEMGRRYLSYRKHSQSREALNIGSLALRFPSSQFTRSSPLTRTAGGEVEMKMNQKVGTGRIVSGVSAAIMTAALATGCNSVSKTNEPTQPSTVATTAAAQSNASQVAEISFDKGSALLNENARQSLIKVINQARSTGLKIDDVRVAAWADREYPTNKQEKLSKADRELADKRGLAVRDFLKTSLSISDVDTYNMAQQPGMFAKAFDTSDAKVKKAFESAGMPSTDSGTTLSAKASRAVVMVITE